MLVVFVLALFAAQADSTSQQLEQRIGQLPNLELKPSDLQYPRLPPGIALDQPLSAEDAVAIALWNNASFHTALAELGLARADLLEAGLLRNPNLSLLFPVGPKPFELAVTLPTEVFWQRPRRVAAAKVNLEVVSHTLVQHGLNLARDAKMAQLELALGQERQTIAAEIATLTERIAELTARRLEAGDISRMELAVADSEAASARAAASAAAESLPPVRERLRSVLGLRRDSTELKATRMNPPADGPGELERLLETALASRPDLRAAELAVEAAAKRAGWERSRVVALGAVLSSKEVGTNGVRTGPGLTLDIPIFNRNQGAVRRADAEVELAAWRYLAARDQVESEVRTAWAQWREARENVRRLREDLIPALQHNAELAERSYQDGDISYFETLVSTQPIIRARLGELDAIAASCRASILLERSIGRKP